MSFLRCFIRSQLVSIFTTLGKWPGLTLTVGACDPRRDDVCASHRGAGSSTFFAQVGHSIVQTTGLGFGRWPQSFGYWIFAWFGLTAIGLATPFVETFLGMLHLDLENFSGYRHILLLRSGGEAALAKYSVQTLVLFQLGTFLVAPAINALFSFGEEWGWRGFLLPKLLPLGQWRALLLTGALWGLWHAPVVLLGYDYPFHPKLGVLLMILFCVIFGILLGWLRLATGSIWPAAIGHGALNAVGGFPYVLADAKQSIDTAHLTILDWTGWILPLLVILLLVVLKRLPVSNPK